MQRINQVIARIATGALLIGMLLAVSACTAAGNRRTLTAEGVRVTNDPQNLLRFDGQVISSSTKDGTYFQVIDEHGVRIWSSAPTSTFVLGSGSKRMVGSTAQTVEIRNLHIQWGKTDGEPNSHGVTLLEVEGLKVDGKEVVSAQSERVRSEVEAIIKMSEDARIARIEELKAGDRLFGQVVEAAVRVILARTPTLADQSVSR